MTKDELKAYISEAVDVLDPVDLEILFPPNNQPDLYTIVEELIGLRGTLNKMSGSNLQLNNEIQRLVEQVTNQQRQQEQLLLTLNQPEETIADDIVDKDFKSLLLKLLDLDELIQLTNDSFQELPSLNWFNYNTYKTQFSSWQKGYDITINRWKKLIQSNSLYKTGLVGEIFDPELHEAIAVKHQNNLTDNSILETEQAGFLYKGKVIRLAKVVVNKVKEVKIVELKPTTEKNIIVDAFNETASVPVLEEELPETEPESKKTQKPPKEKWKNRKRKRNKQKKRKRKRKRRK